MQSIYCAYRTARDSFTNMRLLIIEDDAKLSRQLVRIHVLLRRAAPE